MAPKCAAPEQHKSMDDGRWITKEKGAVKNPGREGTENEKARKFGCEGRWEEGRGSEAGREHIKNTKGSGTKTITK